MFACEDHRVDIIAFGETVRRHHLHQVVEIRLDRSDRRRVAPFGRLQRYQFTPQRFGRSQRFGGGGPLDRDVQIAQDIVEILGVVRDRGESGEAEVGIAGVADAHQRSVVDADRDLTERPSLCAFVKSKTDRYQ